MILNQNNLNGDLDQNQNNFNEGDFDLNQNNLNKGDLNQNRYINFENRNFDFKIKIMPNSVHSN